MHMALIDLDANATTTPFPEVMETVLRIAQDIPGNPGSRHIRGRKARQILEASRDLIAMVLGADPEEVVFTSGGTESNNLAIPGLLQGPPRTILLSPGEHPSNREACRALMQRGWSLKTLTVNRDGTLDSVNDASQNWSEIGLVTVILAQNEIGTVHDVSSLSSICQNYRVPLHLDAVQAIGKIPVHFHRLQATTLSIGAHKFHGPRGIGALLVRRGTTLSSLFQGGHQEHGLRAGTEPVALIAGMAKALELWHRDQEQRTLHLTSLRDRLQVRLSELISPVIVHAAHATRLPNTLNMAFPGIDGEALLVALDLEGICCSLGSTCASGSMEPAPVLLAMGVPIEIAKASVRFSLSVFNTLAEIDDAAQRIASVVNRLRHRTA